MQSRANQQSNSGGGKTNDNNGNSPDDGESPIQHKSNNKDEASTSPPLEPTQTKKDSLAARALPTFRSTPQISAENDDETDDDASISQSESERKLFKTDSITSRWQNVDNIYIGQLFRDYNAIPLSVVRRREPSSLLANNASDNISAEPSDNEDALLSAKQQPNKRVVTLADDTRNDDATSNDNKATTKIESDMSDVDDNSMAAQTASTTSKLPPEQVADNNADETIAVAGALVAASQRNEQFDIAKCTTDSRIKEERLYARRYRIKALKTAEIHNANQTMLAANITAEPNQLKEHDLSLPNAQIERSDKQLFATSEEGETALTNFTAGARKRYAQRRRYMLSELEKVQIMLEEEQHVFSDKFADLMQRFQTAPTDSDPHKTTESLQLLLDEQRAACAERLELKRRVIQRLQDSLRLVDEHYAKSLKKQQLDLQELSESYKQVFKKLLTGFLDETHEVEDVLYEDLNTMKEQFRAQYDQLRSAKYDTEIGVIEQRNSLKDEFDNELEGLRWNEADKFNRLKHKLESDVHTIEQQLVLMKAGFQMNAEKLDYNFQVLRRRDEENTILKAKQKRRITRLQDVLTKLRERQRKQEQFFQRDVESLAGDCSRLAQQIVDLHNKSKHFQKSDVEQFRNVWLVDELDLRQHVYHLLLIDRVVSEQILGLQWQPPDIAWACCEIGPIVASKWKTRQAMSALAVNDNSKADNMLTTTTTSDSKHSAQHDVVHSSLSSSHSPPVHVPSLTAARGATTTQQQDDLLQANNMSAAPLTVKVNRQGGGGIVNAHLNFTLRERQALFDTFYDLNVQRRLDYYQRAQQMADNKSAAVSDELRNISPLLLAHLFERITSETGFLVENKIVPLISAMAFGEQTPQKFVKFDAILRGLGVGTSHDVLKLVQYFVKNLPENLLKMHTTTTTGADKSDKKVDAEKKSAAEVKVLEYADKNPEAENATKPAIGEQKTDEDDEAIDDEISTTNLPSNTANNKNRRLLKFDDLSDRGVTLHVSNIVITDTSKKRPAADAAQPQIASHLLKGLTPLQQARLIKQHQQALARVEADDTNIAAIIQEENELINNATARESEQNKGKHRKQPTTAQGKPVDAQNEPSAAADTVNNIVLLQLPSDVAIKTKNSKDGKKKKNSKKNKSRSVTQKRLEKEPTMSNMAPPTTDDVSNIPQQEIESDNNNNGNDMMSDNIVVDADYTQQPAYMRVSEATNDILGDPLLHALVPLDGVIPILQQFIDDYRALESERKSPSSTELSSTCRDDTLDCVYFERYLALLDLDLRLPIWRVLFDKLHTFYVVMMERVKHRAAHAAQCDRNSGMLDKLGALMTSQHAAKLLLPALTTIVGDYQKRRRNDDDDDSDAIRNGTRTSAARKHGRRQF